MTAMHIGISMNGKDKKYSLYIFSGRSCDRIEAILFFTYTIRDYHY